MVEYYSPEELAPLEVHFDQEGRIYTHGPLLNDWVESRKQCSEDSQQSYRDFYRSYVSGATTIDKNACLLKDGTYMYVLDYKGHLFLQVKNRGKANHTSLSNGAFVLAAGNVQVKEGKITALDMFSGHYKPTKIQVLNMVKHLEQSHVDIDNMKITYVAQYNVQPWIINQINPGKGVNWLNSEKREM